MTKAVFIASSHSSYDDRPGEAYHFPNSYLGRVAQTVGDWVIFYEGRRGGNRGYYAVQKVERVVPDPRDPTQSFAILDRSSLLDFETEVPRLRPTGQPWETGLPLSRGSNTSAVRLISDLDFAAIVTAGLQASIGADAIPRHGPAATFAPANPGMSDAAALFTGPTDPNTVRDRLLTSRAFRDASFARQVKRAYHARCAMSGLSLRNGGGRPEVEAAHIVPVAAKGPDSLSNGLALSGTLHWMFDRGLVSVDADHNILVSPKAVSDNDIARLLTPDRRLLLPPDPARHPHPQYLDWHRSHVFKG